MPIEFIRHQVEPEFVAKLGAAVDQYGPVESVRAYSPGFGGRVPHGRSADGVWGSDVYGYTDADDYYTNLLGA